MSNNRIPLIEGLCSVQTVVIVAVQQREACFTLLYCRWTLEGIVSSLMSIMMIHEKQ